MFFLLRENRHVRENVKIALFFHFVFSTKLERFFTKKKEEFTPKTQKLEKIWERRKNN